METQKIDRRRNYIVVLDTETANDLENPLVYDIGWAIVDKYGNVYRQRSFINREIFFLEEELMQSSYYAEKLPIYYKRIAKGEAKVANWLTIKKILWQDMADFETNIVSAHNARFDYKATATTQRWLTKSAYRYFFPYGTEVWDTLKMARDVIGKMPTYRKWCEVNDYICKNGQLKFTAEVLYRFISGNEDFDEEHTGLADVLIEKDILAYCYRQHKPMRKKLWEN
jgi:DNA polymerase III epsilon subunit-like protein